MLGEGGMGAVYEAHDDGERVAVKLLLGDYSNDANLVRRFQREAKVAGSIGGAHIAQVYDAGTDEQGRPYLAMELLEGEDLNQLLKRIGVLEPELALRITAQACQGLIEARAAKVIHRDIKPSNIFLVYDQSLDEATVTVKLLDFGIAKLVRDDGKAESTEITRTGSLLGSPQYMSPEQAQSLKEIDHRTDIWSLGITLYQTLCGQPPHCDEESIGRVIIAICERPVPPLQDRAPWVGPEIARIVHRALRREPAARFQSPEQMLAEIETVIGDAAITTAMLVPFEGTDGEPRVRIDLPNMTTANAPTAPSGSIAAVATRNELGPERRRAPTKRRWPLLLAACLVAGASAIGIVASRPQQEVSSQPTAAPNPTPTLQRASVRVEPPDATVTYHGKRLPVVEGAITLTAKLGSTHELLLEHDGARTAHRVVITDNGALPAVIRAAAITTATSSQSAPTASSGPSPLPRPSRPAPSATTATTATTSSSTTTPERHPAITRDAGDFN